MDKTKVFVDLDDTIFDAQEFKRAIFAVFTHCCPNMTIDQVAQKYNEHRQNGRNFDPKEFAGEFEEEGADPDEIVREINEVVRDSGQFLFTERLNHLVKSFDPDKYEFILFTKGVRSIQEGKVKACHLESVFDQIIYVEEGKAEALNEAVKSGERFVLFDDRDDVLEEIGSEHGAGELWTFKEGKEPAIYMADQDPSLRELPPQR